MTALDIFYMAPFALIGLFLFAGYFIVLPYMCWRIWGLKGVLLPTALILFIVWIVAGQAHLSHAANDSTRKEVKLAITTKLVQCGKREDMEAMCKLVPICCVFIEPSSGEEDKSDD